MSLHIDGLSCEDNPTQLRAMEDFLALKLPKFILNGSTPFALEDSFNSFHV